MTPERWRQIEDVYHAALARDSAERAAWLAEACAGDDALRREVESLLVAPGSADAFLSEPAAAMAAQLSSGAEQSTLTGRRLGVYQVLELLGVGGMGEVYRARDTRLGRDVAIKRLSRDFASDRDRLARFEREARILASLNHPNISAIYGLEAAPAADGAPFIVMELVDGETLADKLAQGSGLKARGNRPEPEALGPKPRSGLLVPEALAIARQIVDALEAAHERGIVHRDLKPANIKITTAGVVKVLDFGLAKATPATSASDPSNSPTISVHGTRAGVILGTVGYMSPEQARGRPVDKRTDIWSFGCVLFEMLTGRAAFGGATVSDTLGAILNQAPNWQALPVAVPQNIRGLLEHCLEKDHRRRLRDLGDARFELDAPSPPVLPEPARIPTRGHRLPWAITAASTVAAVVALAWIANSSSSSGVDVPRLSQAVRLTDTAAQEFGPAISPDGKWVAFYSNSGGRTDLMVKFLDNGSTLNLTSSLTLDLPARTGIGGIAISPDGTQIAFSARLAPTNILYDTWVVPGPAGGVPRKLLPTVPAVQWSPDGKQLAYTLTGSTRGDGLAVSSSDGTGERVVIERTGGRHLHWPAWSRDSQWLYFISTYDTWHTEPSEIYRVSVSGGNPEPVVRSARRAIYPVPMPGGDLIFAGNPRTLELGLWWLRGAGQPVPLTNGTGEHVEARLSADGRRIVATRLDVHQALAELPVTVDSSVPKNVTDGYGGDLDPSVDRQTGRIVFSSNRSGHRNLWIAKPDGSDPTPLTTETAIDERPSFSPDGDQIVFVSDRGGERGIWLINAQGGAPRLLAREIVLDTLTWSRDGRRVFFATPAGDAPAIASVSVDGGSVERFQTSTAGAFAPGWSPTEDVLAFLEPVTLSSAQPLRNVIKFIDAQGKEVFPNLPRQTNFANGFLAWAPDGQRVAVASVAANAASQIWIVEPRSAQPFRKIAELPPTIRPRGLTWSKNGDRVLYASQQFDGDIVMYDIVR